MQSARARVFLSPFIFFIAASRFFTGFQSVVIGIFGAEDAVVHIGECVGALCFVSP